MEPSESDRFAFRLAECAVRRIDAAPEVLVSQFINELRRLRSLNGPKEPYDAMELAALDSWNALRALLLARDEHGDLVRSMAPLYVAVTQDERIRIIQELT